MCCIGFALMLTFSAQDILTPGFVKSGIVIAETEIKPDESISGTIYMEKTHLPITLMLSSVNNPVIFNLKIETPEGVTINKEYSGGLLKFTPDTSGDYIISIKNLSLKSSVVTISYGSTVNDGNTVFVTALWLGLLIGGNYLVVHSHFLSTKRAIL